MRTHTQTQIRMQNIRQRATPTQWRCLVLPSTAVWIYWLLCGKQIHPSCKNTLSGLLRAAAAPVFWLSVGASAPPLLSYPPTIISGERWERLGAWLAGSARSGVLAASEVICPEHSESLGRDRGRMQGAIWGAMEDKEHPVFQSHWARFSCKNIINLLLSLHIGCNLRMPFSLMLFYHFKIICPAYLSKSFSVDSEKLLSLVPNK